MTFESITFLTTFFKIFLLLSSLAFKKIFLLPINEMAGILEHSLLLKSNSKSIVDKIPKALSFSFNLEEAEIL